MSLFKVGGALDWIEKAIILNNHFFFTYERRVVEKFLRPALLAKIRNIISHDLSRDAIIYAAS